MGAAVVSIYPTSTAETTSFILKNSGSKVIFLESNEHWQIIDQILGELPDLVDAYFKKAEVDQRRNVDQSLLHHGDGQRNCQKNRTHELF